MQSSEAQSCSHPLGGEKDIFLKINLYGAKFARSDNSAERVTLLYILVYFSLQKKILFCIALYTLYTIDRNFGFSNIEEIAEIFSRKIRKLIEFE